MGAHVGHLLRRAYARARRNTADALAALGEVSPVQAAALAALMDGPQAQAELGRRIDTEPANIHTLVARLRSGGLVEVRKGRGRQSLVALTAEGEAIAARLAPLIRASGDRTLAGLDAAERETFLRLLRRVAVD